MPKLILQNINMGGLADSPYLGAKNSVAEMVGFDIHSEVGVMKVNQNLTKESGSTVVNEISVGIACSDGSSYFLSKDNTNPYVYKRTSGGTWSNEATVNPPAGLKGILGGAEYEGYIYYGMGNRLGRWQIGTAWATRNDNFATFTNSSPSWRPFLVLNGVLYIGDGNLVAQVDAGVFSANALDLPTNLVIKCLGQLGTDLLIGTVPNGNGVTTQIYRWNTWSVSFTNSDPIPEIGINAFLPMDNFVLVQAGIRGNIYSYDGVHLDPYKQIAGDYFTKGGYTEPNAVCNWNGLALFGFSYATGSTVPAPFGVYSLGRANKNYPYVLNCEVSPSITSKIGLKITSIVNISASNTGASYLVAWRDVSGNFGVDVYDLTTKYASAYLITRVIMADRFNLLNYGVISVGYRTLPTNTTFTLSTKRNNGSFVAMTAGEVEKDVIKNVFRSKIDINDATTLQVKIAPSVSTNDAPEIEAIAIDLP